MGKRCPDCNREWPKRAQFCGKCGAQLIIGPRRRRSAKRHILLSHGPGAGVMWILDLLPGVTRPVVLLSAMLAFAVALVGVWLAMLFVQFGVITAFAMGGGAMVLYWSGVSWILYGYVCVPVEAMAEFQGKHWTAFFIAAVAPLVLVLLLARTVAERGGM